MPSTIVHLCSDFHYLFAKRDIQSILNLFYFEYFEWKWPLLWETGTTTQMVYHFFYLYKHLLAPWLRYNHSAMVWYGCLYTFFSFSVWFDSVCHTKNLIKHQSGTESHVYVLAWNLPKASSSLTYAVPFAYFLWCYTICMLQRLWLLPLTNVLSFIAKIYYVTFSNMLNIRPHAWIYFMRIPPLLSAKSFGGSFGQ